MIKKIFDEKKNKFFDLLLKGKLDFPPKVFYFFEISWIDVENSLERFEFDFAFRYLERIYGNVECLSHLDIITDDTCTQIFDLLFIGDDFMKVGADNEHN